MLKYADFDVSANIGTFKYAADSPKQQTNNARIIFRLIGRNRCAAAKLQRARTCKIYAITAVFRVSFI